MATKKKAVLKKKTRAKKAPEKKRAERGKARKDQILANDAPIIFDDGGSTRIKQIKDTLDALETNRTVSIGRQPTHAVIVYIDSEGDPKKTQIPAALPLGAVTTIETGLGRPTMRITVSVSLSSPTGFVTTIDLLGNLTVQHKDDPRTGQRSYTGNDAGGISNVNVSGTHHRTPDTAVLTMVRFKFK